MRREVGLWALALCALCGVRLVEGGAYAAPPVMSSGTSGPSTWSATLTVQGSTLSNDMASPRPHAREHIRTWALRAPGWRHLPCITDETAPRPVGVAGERLQHARVLLSRHVWPRGAHHRALPRCVLQIAASQPHVERQFLWELVRTQVMDQPCCTLWRRQATSSA